MKRRGLAVAGFVVAALALGELAQYKDWAKSPEADFLTAGERAEWTRTATDADAEKFIAAYWERRGGEHFKETIQRRIAAADVQFKMLHQRGAESARGRIYIMLGSPTRRTQSVPAASASDDARDAGSGRGGLTGENPFSSGPGPTMESWVYAKDKFDPSWAMGELRASIAVDPQRGADSMKNADEINRVLTIVSEKSIVVPPAAPAAPSAAVSAVASAAAPAPLATPPPLAPATTALVASPGPATASGLPAAARASLESILKGKKADSDFWGGAFHTTAGDPFYAFQFYFAAPRTPPAAGKFGAIVTNDSGIEIASFWEDAIFENAKTGLRSDKAYERSIALAPGAYRAALGVFAAEGSTPVASASVAFRLEPKPAGFDVSPLILANELKPLTRVPAATDPFVFGVEKPVKVAPRGDRALSQQDSLWYFYTVTNPILSEAPKAVAAPETTPASGAPASSAAAGTAPERKPRVMQRVGVLRDGKSAFAPFTGPAEVQMLAAGCYASGSEIPLATFEPGYYTLTINVRDLNAPRGSAAFKGVDRQEDFIVLKPDGSMPEKTAGKPTAAPTPKPHPKKS